MATEIEHKYLITNDSYKTMATEMVDITQGYIDRTPEHVVRVRLLQKKNRSQCFLTIKGITRGDRRHEFEYEVPIADAQGLFSLCTGRIIHKRRWLVPYEGFLWEVDEFRESLEGLAVAEVELPTSDTIYQLPPFVGQNVTHDPAYLNSNL